MSHTECVNMSKEVIKNIVQRNVQMKDIQKTEESTYGRSLVKLGYCLTAAKQVC